MARRLLACLLCALLVFGLVSCQKESNPPQLSGDDASGLVMANDQLNNRVVVYDLARWKSGQTLEKLEVWSVSTGHAAGLKLRTGSPFGDVVIVAGNRSAIYAYPSKETIWSTDDPGNNSHSIELLPTGHIVIANSTGNSLRLFYTNELLQGKSPNQAQTYVDYPLNSAHGVLWDPTYEVLWALGYDELCAYRLKGEGSQLTLEKDPTLGCTLEKGHRGGHDLSPDYTDTRYLYLTVSACALRFDKQTNTVTEDFPHAERLSRKGIKGFSNNPDGCFFVTGETGGDGTPWAEKWEKASWCTDGIYYGYGDAEQGLTVVRIAAKKSAFYKVRAFCGAYQ